MDGIFHFKQFKVDQSGCAMKINTDGVLLAALVEGIAPQRLLDIGTGTGVIALMLAQRFEHAHIEAVEIDAGAALTAGRNFKESRFQERLAVHHTAIEEFDIERKFDLIVSNPPYFVNDLKNVEEKKGIARHTNELFFERLIEKVAYLLSEEGAFWFVLPIKQAGSLIARAAMHGFGVAKQISLHSDKLRPAFRYIVCLKRKTGNPELEQFFIYESERTYTQHYRETLKEFFLGY